MKPDRIIAAVDIGTAKVVAVLADVSDENNIAILGHSEITSKGVKKGSVVNIGLVQHAVSMLLEEIEATSNCKIHSLIVSVSGTSIIGYNSDGVVEVRGSKVNAYDCQKAVIAAKDMAITEGRHLLHILPQSFSVDGHPDVEEPIGLVCNQLKAQVHIISVAKTAHQNLLNIFNRHDIEISYPVASNLASGTAVLTEAEKKLGVCVLDIGAGTTEITIYSGGVIRHSEVIPLGGEQITSDIAYFTLATMDKAQELKHQIDISAKYNANESIEFAGVSGGQSKQYKLSDIAMVAAERCDQLFDIVEQQISRSGYEDSFPTGFVITGGTANLKGLDKLIIEKTNQPVRIATIGMGNVAELKNPKYSNLFGLLLCAKAEDYTRSVAVGEKLGIIGRLMSRIWFGKK